MTSIERQSSLTIQAPPDFDFRATAWSHGWCVLAPVSYDPKTGVLATRLPVEGGVVALALDQPGGRGAPVRARGRGPALTPADRAAIRLGVGRMLRLDQDLAPFHARCRAAGAPFAGAEAAGYGRMLRSATPFEDLAKVLATTNTTWRGTVAMVANLVRLAGVDGAFPTPAAVAAMGAERIRSEARWGYRAEALAKIAEAVASGAVDPAAWESWPGTTEELDEEIRRLPGFGPYAAAQVLALVGRYDRIGVDTVFRAFVLRRYFPRARKPPRDARLLKIYDRWGEWRMLAYWWELWSEEEIDPESLGAAPG